jgi:predicted DNA binding protein
MGNDENDNKPTGLDNIEKDKPSVVSSLELAEELDRVNEIISDIHARAMNAGESTGENPDGARDLTDEELRILKRSFQEGLQKLKDHPWNGKKDET